MYIYGRVGVRDVSNKERRRAFPFAASKHRYPSSAFVPPRQNSTDVRHSRARIDEAKTARRFAFSPPPSRFSPSFHDYACFQTVRVIRIISFLVGNLSALIFLRNLIIILKYEKFEIWNRIGENFDWKNQKE